MEGKWAKIDTRGLLLVTIAIAWLTGIALDSLLPLPPLLLLIGVGIAGIFIALLRHDERGRFIMLLLLSAFLGAGRYSLAWPGYDTQALATFIGSDPVMIQGVVADEPKLVGSKSRLLVIAANSLSRDNGTSWQAVHGSLQALTLGTEIEDPYGANYGDPVKLSGKLKSPTPPATAGVFASMDFPRVTVTPGDGNSITTLMAFFYHLRVTLANSIARSLPQPEAALLIAILLSLHTPELTPLKNAFNVTGTAHMIAPSGFKVTILAGLVANSTRWLATEQPGQRSRQQPPGRNISTHKPGQWRRLLAISLVIMGIAMYTILSGAGPAAIRAGVMGILLVIAPRIGRTYNVYTALAATALAMSLIDPFVVYDIGFQLSFVGTVGILLFTPFFQHLLHRIEQIPFGGIIVENIAVTLAAQLATLPIMAKYFGLISLIAPIANVLTVPLLGTLITAGMSISIAGTIFPPLATLCGWITYPVLWYMEHSIIWLANFPAIPSPPDSILNLLTWVYYVLLSTLTGFLGRYLFAIQLSQTPTLPLSRRTWILLRAGAALLMILAIGIAELTTPADAQLTITFLDVGPTITVPSASTATQTISSHQGEAILLHTPDGKTILIDGGLDATSLAQVLDSRLPLWQRSLDALILTSPLADHMSATEDILNRYNIGVVLDAGMLHPNTAYARWRRIIRERGFRYLSVAQGDTLPISTGISLQVLWPLSQLHSSSDERRDNALVIRLVAPGLHVLLLGATAQSSYALSGLMSHLTSNSLQSEIVQMVGEKQKPDPTELENVLQEAHPSLLIVTPASLSPAQRKTGNTSTVLAPSSLPVGSWQTQQTAQVGTVEVKSSNTGWDWSIL